MTSQDTGDNTTTPQATQARSGVWVEFPRSVAPQVYQPHPWFQHTVLQCTAALKGRPSGHQTVARAELYAICMALYHLRGKKRVLLVSDSAWTVKFLTKDLRRCVRMWAGQAHGGPRALPTAHWDLWLLAACLVQYIEHLHVLWVPSHAGVGGNVQADRLARAAFDSSNDEAIMGEFCAAQLAVLQETPHAMRVVSEWSLGEADH